MPLLLATLQTLEELLVEHGRVAPEWVNEYRENRNPLESFSALLEGWH
jgi:hypothetical protein